MEIQEIVGHAQTSFGGVVHAIDFNGNTFCKTIGGDGRLFDDEFPGEMHIDQIDCKRCLRKIKAHE